MQQANTAVSQANLSHDLAQTDLSQVGMTGAALGLVKGAFQNALERISNTVATGIKITAFSLMFAGGTANKAEAGLLTGMTPYQGDPIGNGNAATNGNGAMLSNIPTSYNISQIVNAVAAIGYTNNGSAQELTGIRAIVSATPTATSGINWSEYNWTVMVWEKSAFLNSQPAAAVINLGNTPENWSGFVTHSPTLVIPDTQPFGNAGGNTNGADSFEMIFTKNGNEHAFNLFNLAIDNIQGDAIVGFVSQSVPVSYGNTLVGMSFTGGGPQPYYRNDLLNMPPAAINSPGFHWAFNVYTVAPEPSSAMLALLTIAYVGLTHRGSRVD